MISYSRPSRQVRVKSPPKVVYALKASCIVLCPEGRMNLVQFCMLLMTIDKQIKTNKGEPSYDKPEHTYRPKIKGSLISGPFYLKLNFNVINIILHVYVSVVLYQFFQLFLLLNHE